MVDSLRFVFELGFEHLAVVGDRPNVLRKIPPELFAEKSPLRSFFQKAERGFPLENMDGVAQGFGGLLVVGAWRLQAEITRISFVLGIPSVADRFGETGAQGLVRITIKLPFGIYTALCAPFHDLKTYSGGSWLSSSLVPKVLDTLPGHRLAAPGKIDL